MRASLSSFQPPETGASDETRNDRIGELERQIHELQDVVRTLQSKAEGAGGEEVELDGGDEAVVGNEVGLFKGRGVRTFYYGPSSPITVVAHVGLRFS